MQTTTSDFKAFLSANFDAKALRVYQIKGHKNLFRATFATLTRKVGEIDQLVSIVQYDSETGAILFINTDQDREITVDVTTMQAIYEETYARLHAQLPSDNLEASKTTETIPATPVEETPVATVTAPKASKKAPKAPKVPAPTATPRVEKKAPPVEKKAAPEKKAPATPRKPAGFRWTEKRVAIVKALRALKANGELNARSGEEIQTKAGEEITLQDVKHYLYKDNDLVTNGYTGCIKGREGIKGVGYFLTEKGMKADLTLPTPPTA